MSRLIKHQALIRAARDSQTMQRVEIPRVTCDRCAAEQWALPDGSPRPHLRPAVRGDPGWCELVPVRVSCE
jgi:hypothetical protein